MPRSVGLTHIFRQNDGTVHGAWGVHTLRSAFQPIFVLDGDSLQTVAFEGLLRAFRDGEPVPPKAFFASVEPEQRFDVETLTRTMHLLNAETCIDASCSIFVNINPGVFGQADAVDRALRDMRLVLHESRIEPSRIVCEITEQKTTSDRALDAFAEALREHGFRIAVDDYGAEESDFSRVAKLGPDIVKFDGDWVMRLMRSQPGFDLLSEMVEAFEDKGINTVFEGIEESWQLEHAVRTRVSMLQGFALSRPQLARPLDLPVMRPAMRSGDGEAAAGIGAPVAQTGSARTAPTFGKRVAVS